MTEPNPISQDLGLHALNLSPHSGSESYPPTMPISLSGDSNFITPSDGCAGPGQLPTPSVMTTKKGLWSVTNETQRRLQSRHLTMISLSGTIGAGVFLSTGVSVSTGGPGSAVLSYLLLSVFVYAMMTVLGEMSSMYPVSGAFSTFGTRFVSPGLGFVLGWNYWLQCSIAIPSELTASVLILKFWTPRLLTWQWAIIINVPVFVFQLTHVGAYGESEFWFAMIKVAMIIFFIIVGLIYDWGGVKGHPGPGLSNFKGDQVFIGGFSAFAVNIIYALYTFEGVELVSIAAGEASKPYKSVPRATKTTFYRVVLFYMLTILTVALCINHTDDTLLNATSASAPVSPVTVVFRRAGFGAATHVVNAVLLTTALSVTNANYYASSRMLLALARSGQAPRIFGLVNQRGVPVPALLLTLTFSCLTFLTTVCGQSAVFIWLINAVGMSTLIIWTSIGVISLRFRQAYKAQGHSLSDLPYQQPFYPLLPICVIVLGILMFVSVAYESLRQQPLDPRNVLSIYLVIAMYISLFGGFVLYERFYEGKKRHFILTSEADLTTGAVWKPGDGDKVRAQDHRDSDKKSSMKSALWRVL